MATIFYKFGNNPNADMKKVLGLDLGTTSIGWAMVNVAESSDETSSIIRSGVRVNPLSSDEKGAFEKGKAITTNADRTLARSARRNLQRYKLRRDGLIALFKREHWIDESTPLYEYGSGTTLETLNLRARSVVEEISLSELARVFLNINKKRGYKSSRKAVSSDEGELVDGMKVAKLIHDRNITPGQYLLELLQANVKTAPVFYKSDLEYELSRVLDVQRQYHPEVVDDSLISSIAGCGAVAASKLFVERFDIYAAENKGKDKYGNLIRWRAQAVTGMVEPSVLASVVICLCGEIRNANGYLGAISDRSKELYFNGQTVGQYLLDNIKKDRNYSTRNKVFYRQDYVDEFERIWDCQAAFHPELSEKLKREIRDTLIFYQRRLKSQKGLVGFCEFESRPIKVLVNGVEKIKTSGCKVAPRSSILFQEFKIWSYLNNITITNRQTQEKQKLNGQDKALLFKELTIRRKLSASEALSLLNVSPRKFELNYKELEGNTTISILVEKFLRIVEYTGNGECDVKIGYDKVMDLLGKVFKAYGFNESMLHFDSSLPKEEYERQPLFLLWHLLYSYEGDNSVTGDAGLIHKLMVLCQMPEEYAKVLASTTFTDEYSALSHKAISRILPYLKEGNTYDVACAYAGYNHSSYETREVRDSKELKERLDNIPKGELRNPVVEKIVNQMINVVNAVADEYGKPDEIHIELARELKQNAEQRANMTRDIAARARANDELEELIRTKYNRPYVSKTDILRYRLYLELKENCFKTLYSNKYISEQDVFSKDIDIEHIIPQALLFDDSFSNKTLEYKDVNIEKGKSTANDYVIAKYGTDVHAQYKARVEDLYAKGVISKAKCNKLLMKQADIPSSFINRDLTCSQYIAKKAKEILEQYVRTVITTTGEVTARLREDWQLVDVMKELDMPKYERAGMVETFKLEDGRIVKKISNWTKRNDHRHHAMDALTIAFTRASHIQILNNLNACSEQGSAMYAMKKKEMVPSGANRIFIPPMPLDKLRRDVKISLQDILVSIKAKNKVATRNVNKIRTKHGVVCKVELTPRGQLHKEQVYGRRQRYETYEVPVNGKMTKEAVATVSSQRVREALTQRLSSFGNDPKKAFTGRNSLDKNPVWLNDIHSECVPAKVKCTRMKTVYSIRKDVSPDLSVEKIADVRVREIIEKRVESFNGNIKAALSNLEDNPIWLDEKRRIPIRRVAINENMDLFPIRGKFGIAGKPMVDSNDIVTRYDYVNPRNNHHIALYLDPEGNVQEKVVTMLEAVERINKGLSVVDKSHNHDLGWSFMFTMKINEMFVFPNVATGFNPKDIDLTNPGNYSAISPNLFRVQKLSSKIYQFMHHLETCIGDDKNLKDIVWKRVNSINYMKSVLKVRINHLGMIVAVGEYD